MRGEIYNDSGDDEMKTNMNLLADFTEEDLCQLQDTYVFMP
jgi:hypothetical protein